MMSMLLPLVTVKVFKADTHLIHLMEKASDVLDAKTRVVTGRILGGDQFISKVEEREELYQFYAGDCAEIEGGAAIAQVCYLNRIPFVAVRSITDRADNTAGMDFNEFTRQAAVNSTKLLLRLLTLL